MIDFRLYYKGIKVYGRGHHLKDVATIYCVLSAY